MDTYGHLMPNAFAGVGVHFDAILASAQDVVKTNGAMSTQGSRVGSGTSTAPQIV